MLIYCAEYAQDTKISLSTEQERSLFSIRHAWELTDFEANGQKIAKKALLDYGLREERYGLHFELAADYPGWKRLFLPER